MVHDKTYKDIPTFYAKSPAAWRKWLEKNHLKEKAVWLIIYKKAAQVPSVNYAEAVDEALCFGWIDSKANTKDELSYYQYFAKRNPKSKWSKVNKEKVAQFIKEGKMAPEGFSHDRISKKTGTWDALNAVDELIVPDDMLKLFKKNKTAFANWNSFSRSVQRGILEWISNAKRVETRQKRIDETITLAAKNIKANQYRQ
ncbi:MAG: YdeI/OmpD-associated family protein [Bacteroidetes bacterium]|nr:YdeI/OmpD-associated family protein [Bacteroidota bacterium]